MTNLLSELCFPIWEVKESLHGMWQFRLIFLWSCCSVRYCVRHFHTFVSFSVNWQWICYPYIKHFRNEKTQKWLSRWWTAREEMARRWFLWSSSLRQEIWMGFETQGFYNHKGKLSISHLWMGASLVVQWWRIHQPCRRCRFDPWVGRFPGEGNGNPTHISILAWEIQWTEKPGGL